MKERVLGAGGSGPSYAELNEAAAALPPGSEGLVCLDHFQVRKGAWEQACAWTVALL